MARILLVDDDDAILFAFRKVLGGPSVIVDTAQSCKEALARLQLKSYEAVIADLRLTSADEIEGFEVIRQAKRMQTDSKVIVVTGCGEKSVKEKVFQLGASKFIEKPVSPQKVKGMLQSMGVLSV